jgi:hypothetical protein
VGLALAGPVARVPLAGAAGNSDAAHACQHGGYANLAGTTSLGQVVTFKNEGDCVGYAAQGGQFTTPLPTCTVTATTGCLTFNGITLPSAMGTGNSITLTGATTFDDTCSACIQSAFPNTLATGGGNYVETDSSGGIISQGIYRVADTAGSSEGLYFTHFTDSTISNPLACTSATVRQVLTVATLIDKNTGASQTVGIGAVTAPTMDYAVLQQLVGATDGFEGPVPATTITC